MGASRTSNKDILAAIEAQTAAIGRLADAIVNSPAGETPPAAEQPSAAPETPKGTVNVPANYKAVMDGKAQEHANKHDTDVILYARRNTRGETKLAFCQLARWPSVQTNDRGLLGKVQQFSPQTSS